jgi:hypothetical protein
MLDETRLTRKSTSYAISTSGAINDRVLMEVANQYQNQVAGRMQALAPQDLARRYAGDEPVLETTKYDGEGVFVYFEARRKPYEIVAFNAPSGRARVGLPALQHLAEELHRQGVKRSLLRAELYLPGMADGKRHSSNDVARASYSTAEADHARLRLALLDAVMLDGRDYRAAQAEWQSVWALLEKLGGSDFDAPCHRAEGTVLPESKLPEVFERKTQAGIEGLVIRRLNRQEIAKVKPHLTFDAAIIGYVEGDADGQPGVASLLTGLTYPAQNGRTLLQVFARVGSGMDSAQRVELLRTLSATQIEAPLPITDSDGRPVNFVRPDLVAELEGDDLLMTNRGDRENLTQLLSWDGSRFDYHRLTPCPRLLFPIFGKLRGDKAFPSGVPIRQVMPHAPTPDARPADASPPQILRREVYRKEANGDVAVRKLVVVERREPEAYPYVLYWTDFSSKRKDPLKVSTSYAMTRTRADTLAARLIEEGVTRGFERVGAASDTGKAAGTEAPAEPAAEAKPKKPRAKKAAGEAPQ